MIILTLHGVGSPSRPLEPGEGHVWLARDMFEAILEELPKFEEFMLTVDDANRSDTTIVLPALLARKQTAIFFISTGKLGQPGYLEKEDVRILVDEGMEIGTHGMHHRDWRKLDQAELSMEIDRSKDILEEITGRGIRDVSCPYGSYDRRVLRYLRNAAFRRVYTSDRGRAQSERWLQPRNSLNAADNPQTLRRIVAECDSLSKRLARSAKGLVKRWR